jgi:hypothetical protein
MRYSIVFASLILASCMPTPPPTAPVPSPQIQKLTSACEAGDLEACKFLATLQSQQASQPRIMPMYYPAVPNTSSNSLAETYWGPQRNLKPLVYTPPLQTTTTCSYVFGNLVCNTN